MVPGDFFQSLTFTQLEKFGLAGIGETFPTLTNRRRLGCRATNDQPCLTGPSYGSIFGKLKGRKDILCMCKNISLFVRSYICAAIQ
jgi:hypothetical protein